MNKEFDKQMQRLWYMSFCNNDEIDRIISPKNPADYLLQQRADIVADNTRYYRVYLHKSNLVPNWSFEKSFNNGHYLRVLNNLSDNDRLFCKNITFGDIFSNDANGYAEYNKTWGRIIYLNECLQFFMKFCNLALFDFDIEVPDEIRHNSLRIAIRIMLKQESMDFFMDPRGIIPETVANKIIMPIKYELQYIAGHEFSHHLCQHFDDKNIVKKTVLSINEKEYVKPIYNISQKQEFEADIASINRPLYSDDEFKKVLEGALIWFISLDLSETAQEIVFPTSTFDIKTHPSAQERFDNILENVNIPKDFDIPKIKKIIRNSQHLKEWLREDLSINYELYDFYGSLYLDKPNTKWRGRELIDRVDY